MCSFDLFALIEGTMLLLSIICSVWQWYKLFLCFNAFMMCLVLSSFYYCSIGSSLALWLYYSSGSLFLMFSFPFSPQQFTHNSFSLLNIVGNTPTAYWFSIDVVRVLHHTEIPIASLFCKCWYKLLFLKIFY